jgi:hypothetical protein
VVHDSPSTASDTGMGSLNVPAKIEYRGSGDLIRICLDITKALGDLPRFSSWMTLFTMEWMICRFGIASTGLTSRGR